MTLQLKNLMMGKVYLQIKILFMVQVLLARMNLLVFSFGATATGSAMSIGEGVFCSWNFWPGSSETLILDQYGGTPSYRIGFDVQEDFISVMKIHH